MAEKLYRNFGGGILGPDEPNISRIKNMHIQHIWIKLPAGPGLFSLKEKLRKINGSMYFNADFRSVKIIIDVDPY